MTLAKLPPSVIDRRAFVYVRQSTSTQVEEHLESQRRQYELVDLAYGYGFREVQVIDEDLGRSASSTSDRPGFRNLVAHVCEGTVGAVLCLEASRLARNGRDWHHLLELCGMVGARVIDAEGIYDPGAPNDRLLLGLKGTMSEFELTIMRRRLQDAVQAKAKRGELRIGVPAGYVWDQETGLITDPDQRVQEAIRTLFDLFERHGSARQVLLHMRRDGLQLPRRLSGKRTVWRAPSYRGVLAVLQNPFYSGAYAFGKSTMRTKIVDGVLVKRQSPARRRSEWTVLVRDHHEAYVSWEQYEANQQLLARNAFCKPAGGAKSGRGGRALMAGLLRCRRCGRKLQAAYVGRSALGRYSCQIGERDHGLERCITFGARRPDDAIAHQLLVALQPLSVEAALQAERDATNQMDERRRALELELQQAQYEVQLATRRYEAIDPDNRLVAAELERRWNVALERLHACEQRLAAENGRDPKPAVDRDSLMTLAADLDAAWSSPSTTMRTKQRLLRALVEEIVVDVDERTRQVVMLIHWRGGRHSEVRVRKPRAGEHTRRASQQADALIRDMAERWSDEHIAATLNRMGLTTGQGNTWTAARVATYRHRTGLRPSGPATTGGDHLTLLEAARKAGVSNHAIRKLIKKGILPAHQAVPDAPWQIRLADLERPEVQEALRRRSTRRGRPCRNARDDRTLVIPGT